MGKALNEDGAVHVFNTSSGTWETLKPSAGDFPCSRSYHCATSTPGSFVIHAGCGDTDASPTSGTKGRLWDAWSFDCNSLTWSRLPDSPQPGRGGSAITASDGLFRFGGFSGVTEVGGAVDSLPVGDKAWTTSVFGETEGLSREDKKDLQRGDGPGPRSVHGLHAVGDHLVTLYGEGKPSPTGGHDAAGNFWDDVWRYNPKTKEWEEVEIQGEKPTARGWFASDARDGRVVMWGGLNAQNERLGDGWVLRFD